MGALFAREKLSVGDTVNLHPPGFEVLNKRLCNSSPPHAFMARTE